MGPYISVLLMLVAGVAAIAALYLLARQTAVSKDPLQSTAYLSGWEPAEHALSRFHARWYPLTLLFLAFDVEMLFMYPWAVVVSGIGVKAVVEMFIFLGVLMVAVVWAWREGALRWT